ncbi:MAG: DNA cytosine methyltransferase [bacterium]|nr:DNA cytosine methyltransferase [bacterium]
MKKKIIVVSLFSNLDLFLKAWVKLGALPGFACEINKWPAMIHAANFKYPDGTPVLTPCIEITWEDVLKMKEREKEENISLSNEWWEEDGRFYRHKKVEEINGGEIREQCVKVYGPDIIIILIGGPPCTDLTKLNRTRDRGRTKLIFEFLRILKELDPDVALMEEAKELLEKQERETLLKLLQQSKLLPFKLAYMHMNAIHYAEGRQSRTRTVFEFIAERWNKLPVFPVAEPEKAKRVGELMDIDRWFSGNFTDKIRTDLDFMTTLTSGSPLWVAKDGVKRKPTFAEKMFFMGAEEGDFILPEGIKISQFELSKAAGNGVCMNLSHALATTIIEKILCLRYDGNGFFVPIDNSTEPSPDNDGSVNLDGQTTSDSAAIDIENNVPNETTKQILLSSAHNSLTKISVPVEILPTEVLSLDSISTAMNQEEYLTLQREEIQKKNSIEVIASRSENPKIISSDQLQNMHFDTLQFNGKWDAFFGNTSLNFFAVLYGLPGHGKSTFAIQFAKFLADNLGKVIYISGEEGFSMTFKNKFVLNKVDSKQLFVADLRTFDDIMRVVPAESYRFIFIDSLDNMNIDADKMKAIRRKYKNAAIISICQSTKAGLMRGSQEIVHDSDIVIQVQDGLATTTKNRFKEKGMTYEVFEELTVIEVEQ